MATNGVPIGELREEQLPELRNIPVYADGEEIGHVGDVYYDDASGQVACVGVKGDALGVSRQWVPVHGGVLRPDGLYLDYGRERFDDAPRWEDEELDSDRFAQVQQHFVRHEEELAVGTQQVDAGAVRLRKWVETEPVAVDVALQRETARVVREQIDEPAADGAIGEEVVEVPLTAEQPVVQKQTVAKERVGIEKEVETVQHTVQDEVRKERVEVEDDPR